MVEDRLEVIRKRMWQILECCGETNPIRFEPDLNELSQLEQPQIGEDLAPAITLKDVSTPWILEEWRRVSMPQWRRILKEAEAAGDTGRAEYAWWMLSEVLEAETGED